MCFAWFLAVYSSMAESTELRVLGTCAALLHRMAACWNGGCALLHIHAFHVQHRCVLNNVETWQFELCLLPREYIPGRVFVWRNVTLTCLYVLRCATSLRAPPYFFQVSLLSLKEETSLSVVARYTSPHPLVTCSSIVHKTYQYV